MRKFTKTTMISLAVSLVLTSGSALAKITAEEAKKLGNELTLWGQNKKPMQMVLSLNGPVV